MKAIESELGETTEGKPKTGFLEKLKIHKFKILGGVLGVFVLAGAVFGAYKFGQRQVQPGPKPTPTPMIVVTPTPDLTADWKTYESGRMKFSMKLPLDWFSHEETELLSRWAAVFSFPVDNPSLYGFAEGQKAEVIIYYHPSLSETLEESLRRLPERGYYPLGESLSSIKSYLTVGGEQALLVENSIAQQSMVLINHGGGYIIRFSVFGETERQNYELYKQTFNLMLSTFKFTSEEAVGEKVFCKEPRPQVCTMECIQNPPYICGSDGKSYCSTCQACSNPKVEWYVIQDKPCGAE